MPLIKLVVGTTMVVMLACSGDVYYKNSGQKLLKTYKGNYAIVISKKNFALFVVSREKIIKKYTIAYGLNPDKKPKLYENDNRTPEGLYYVTEILSMDAPKHSSSYKKLQGMNRVYFKASKGHYKFGYPDVDLGDNAYGPRFYRISYPNDNDIKQYEQAKIHGALPLYNGNIPSIGGGIAIHGNNDPDSIGHLATSGCIRMLNDDVIELEQFIQIGTPVYIVSD
jgi:murein L,D-transpeptidase YafK